MHPTLDGLARHRGKNANFKIRFSPFDKELFRLPETHEIPKCQKKGNTPQKKNILQILDENFVRFVVLSLFGSYSHYHFIVRLFRFYRIMHTKRAFWNHCGLVETIPNHLRNPVLQASLCRIDF